MWWTGSPFSLPSNLKHIVNVARNKFATARCIEYYMFSDGKCKKKQLCNELVTKKKVCNSCSVWLLPFQWKPLKWGNKLFKSYVINWINFELVWPTKKKSRSEVFILLNIERSMIFYTLKQFRLSIFQAPTRCFHWQFWCI